MKATMQKLSARMKLPKWEKFVYCSTCNSEVVVNKRVTNCPICDSPHIYEVRT